MTEQIMQAARAEEHRLRAELEALPLFRKLEAIRAVITLYEDLPVQASAPTRKLPTRAAEARQVAQPVRGSRQASVGQAAAEYLREIGRRAMSPEIAKALEVSGHVLTGSKPIATLASALSHNSLFDNVLGKGYGLKEWNGGPGPKAKPPNGFFDGSHLPSAQEAEAPANPNPAPDEQLVMPPNDGLSGPHVSDQG